ncbi:MAG TPA: protein kinase [Polyangiaceae bacterium]|nr:protein kinase [Polyangiaceae bacterium]
MSADNEPVVDKSAGPASDDGLPKEGDVIAGKYQVEKVLGKGGMGVVVAARHTSLRQHVAVKFLLPKALTLPGAAERFLREARAAVAIRSEHVARVIDVGELESGAPYMVMEYLTGTDFGQVLKTRGTLPLKEAVDYVLQACEALAEAHALGVVHRDLKPGNLFLTTRADGSPLVKVLDFGLSKATKPGEDEHSLTAPDVIVGSPHYMSPEQLRSLKQVDARSDVWALGVILYQLLSGRRPFESDSLVGTCARIAAEPPTPLRERKPDVPAELETIIGRCLEKDREKRLQTVADLARLLAPYGSERAPISVERIVRVIEGERASVSGVSTLQLSEKDIIAQDPTAAASAWGKTSERARRAPTTAIVTVGAVIAFGVAILLLIRSGSQEHPAQQPAAAATSLPAPQPVQPPITTAAVEPTSAPTQSAAANTAPGAPAQTSEPAAPSPTADPKERPGKTTSKTTSPTKPGATSAPTSAAPKSTTGIGKKDLDRFD